MKLDINKIDPQNSYKFEKIESLLDDSYGRDHLSSMYYYPYDIVIGSIQGISSRKLMNDLPYGNICITSDKKTYGVAALVYISQQLAEREVYDYFDHYGFPLDFDNDEVVGFQKGGQGVVFTRKIDAFIVKSENHPNFYHDDLTSHIKDNIKKAMSLVETLIPSYYQKNLKNIEF